MSRKVAIIAVAQTKYEASNTNQSNSELLWEVTKKILEQTSLKFKRRIYEIDTGDSEIGISLPWGSTSR